MQRDKPWPSTHNQSTLSRGKRARDARPPLPPAFPHTCPSASGVSSAISGCGCGYSASRASPFFLARLPSCGTDTRRAKPNCAGGGVHVGSQPQQGVGCWAQQTWGGWHKRMRQHRRLPAQLLSIQRLCSRCPASPPGGRRRGRQRWTASGTPIPAHRAPPPLHARMPGLAGRRE
jgi:hypothetical protein